MAKLVDAPVIFYRLQHCKSHSYYKNNMETGAIRCGGSSPYLLATYAGSSSIGRAIVL